ncbi:hypothetical protein [Streptomyces sp. NPDC047525]|uniref:hypothetical protein n=1 Tax=Streptomyces sp. NPDC047525 TaxID=3155264 RepID=UPI0033E3B321
MTEPSVQPPPKIQVVQVDTLDTDLLALVVRCLATTRLGARFYCVSQYGRTVELTLTEIRRYPTVTVTEVDPPHPAQLVLTGPGTGRDGLRLWAGDVLRGINPVA